MWDRSSLPRKSLLTKHVKIRARTTSKDEAEQKYENVVCMSLRGLSLFIKYYFASAAMTNEAASKQLGSLPKLETIFSDPKFWKLSKDTSAKVGRDGGENETLFSISVLVMI